MLGPHLPVCTGVAPSPRPPEGSHASSAPGAVGPAPPGSYRGLSQSLQGSNLFLNTRTGADSRSRPGSRCGLRGADATLPLWDTVCAGNSAPPPLRTELRAQPLFPGGQLRNGAVCAGTRGPGPGRAGGQHPNRGDNARPGGTARGRGTVPDRGEQRRAGRRASDRAGQRQAGQDRAHSPHGPGEWWLLVGGGPAAGPLGELRARGVPGSSPPSAVPPGRCRRPGAPGRECGARGLPCTGNGPRERGAVVLARCSPAGVPCTRALC